MLRWLTLILLLSGLGATSYLSWSTAGDGATIEEDGSGFPPPRP